MSREAQRSKVYSYGWCCLKAFRVGVQKARELWQQLALHTLLHPAALLHEKLPLLLFCLGFVFSTEEKQSAVNHQGWPMFLQDKEVWWYKPLNFQFGPVATSFWSSAFALGEEKAIFSVMLVLKKTASVFLGIFSIFFLPHSMIIRLAPKQAQQLVFHVKAGTASIREDAPDAPLALSHPPWSS